jgi:exonuclease III
MCNELKCFYTNATSLNNKLNETKEFIIKNGYPHILLFSETWYNKKSTTSIEHYQLFMKNRKEQDGGGVAIYVRKDIRCSEFKVNDIEQIEQIWCSIEHNNKKILVGCIYRPPTTNKELNKEINISLVEARSLVTTKIFSGMIVVGDFNHNDIIWQDDENMNIKYKFKSKNGKKTSRNFIECIEKNRMIQHVNGPTYNENFLDLILSDQYDRVSKLSIGPPLSNSKKNYLHSTINFCVSTYD